jgi:predicted MFS family arabinose efflux permease
MRRRVPRLLRVNPGFRDYWTGQTISLFGDQIALLAIPLLAVLTLDADAQQMGLLGAVEMIPNLLFAFAFGAWADRRASRRAILIGADLGRALVLFGIPLAAVFGVLTMPILYVAAFATGTLGTLFMVSEQTVFTSLVKPTEYVEANSLLIGSRSVAIASGKTLGGLLVAALSAPVAIAVDALTFLGSALFVRRVDVPEPPAAPPDSDLAAGIRFIRRTPLLQASLLGTATFNLFNTAFWALLVLFATREMGLGSGAIGIALGVGALGSILGSVWARRLNARIGLGKALIFSFVLAPLPLLLVPIPVGSPTLAWILLTAAEFGSGIGVMILEVGLFSVQAALIPDGLRSRVWGAILFVNWGVRPLGALGGGLLAGAIGLRPTMWIAAIGGIAGVLWLIPSRMSKVRDVSEDGLAEDPPAVESEDAPPVPVGV